MPTDFNVKHDVGEVKVRLSLGQSTILYTIAIGLLIALVLLRK